MKSRSQKARGQSSQTRNRAESDLLDLFLSELADILNAERQLTKALPKMANAAEAKELAAAFQKHLAETKKQIDRIERAFKSMDKPVKRKKCMGMEGLLEEGNEMAQEVQDTLAVDAALIAAAQKVEHYEIASYGTLIAWARQMGQDKVADLLAQNLEEEKAADEKLTDIAESLANQTAAAMD
jgi:ferritin-like metal-binding protein YciE